MTPAIGISGVVKRFDEITALGGVDLIVEQGEVHGLLGPNGAGKSTLLRILFGLVQPDAGTAAIFGQEHQVEGSVATLAAVAGFVDRPHFYPYLTARQTLRMLARADGTGGESSIDDVLAATGLAGSADRRVRGWSTGMRQRLGVACALVRQPKLLILDEPTEGLDPVGSRQLMELLRSVAAQGVTVLLSSHDMAEVDALCDGATILRRGQVVRAGRLADLRASAPPGRHRLATSNDELAIAIAGRLLVDVAPHPRGGLSLQTDPAALHRYVCAMGKDDVSVTLLELDVDPLTALFYELTADAPALAATA